MGLVFTGLAYVHGRDCGNVAGLVDRASDLVDRSDSRWPDLGRWNIINRRHDAVADRSAAGTTTI